VLGLDALGLLDRDDAVLADLVHDLGEDAAISVSPLAEIVATWHLLDGGGVALDGPEVAMAVSTARSMPS